jgi:hypothetical protein
MRPSDQLFCENEFLAPQAVLRKLIEIFMIIRTELNHIVIVFNGLILLIKNLVLCCQPLTLLEIRFSGKGLKYSFSLPDILLLGGN